MTLDALVVALGSLRDSFVEGARLGLWIGLALGTPVGLVKGWLAIRRRVPSG